MLNATISVHGSLLANPFAANTSLPPLPAASTNTLQNVRAPAPTQPLGNKPLDNPLPSSDSEISDYNDEENNRPAVPLLQPEPSAKSKGKQKANDLPEDKQEDDVLMQADRDDNVLQDPEQLPTTVDLAAQGEGIPVVKEKKKKKRKAAATEMEVDPTPTQPPKKKRKSDVKEADAMDVDEPKTSKKKRKVAAESAAVNLPTLPSATGRKEKKAKGEKKSKQKAQ